MFGDSTVPQYEINHRTVAVLHELMQRCEERDREKQLQLDDLNQKAEEYHAEGKYIRFICNDFVFIYSSKHK